MERQGRVNLDHAALAEPLPFTQHLRQKWYYAVLLVVALAVGLHPDPYVIQAAVLTLIYAYLATAWNIIGGYGGQLSLAHGALFAVGANSAALLYLHLGLTPWIGLPLVGVMTALLGAFVGFVSLRLRGVYFALVTLAFHETLRVIFTSVPFLGGGQGLFLPMNPGFWEMQFLSYNPYYYIGLVLLIIGMAVSAWVKHSPLGYALQAVRGDEDAAAAMGIDNFRTKLWAMIISSALVGLGGGFYVQFFLYTEPEHIFSLNYAVQMLLASLLGGIGTVWGPVLGALLLSGFEQAVQAIPLSSRYIATGVQMVYGLGIAFLVIYAPSGLMGVWQRRKAARSKA